jgi:hypothetical protein
MAHNHYTLGGPTWTAEYRLECEARYLLAMPLEERRYALRSPKRAGRVDDLKREMIRLHAARK